MKAFVISNIDDFERSVTTLRAMGLNPERLDPVYTEKKCVKSESEPTSGETGCFLAHKTAWERIAREPSKSIVLEQDWSIGTQDPVELRSKLENIANTDNDYIALGHCYKKF